MDDAAREALDQSIAKWEANLEAAKRGDLAGIKLGPGECQLCKVFYFQGDDNQTCVGCPISARTGAPGCQETPYDLVLWNYRSSLIRSHCDDDHSRVVRQRLTDSVRDELNFLKSLITTEEPACG